MCLERANNWEVLGPFRRCLRHLPVVEHHITGGLSMHLAAPIMVDQRMSLPNARWSSNNVFPPPPLFPLFNLETYAATAKN
jgi:hypothetical protein